MQTTDAEYITDQSECRPEQQDTQKSQVQNKHRFHRSYKEQYDDTLYRIVGINEQMPQVMYQLARAVDDDEIEGKFYGPEICKVTQDEIYAIETIIEVDKKKTSTS